MSADEINNDKPQKITKSHVITSKQNKEGTSDSTTGRPVSWEHVHQQQMPPNYQYSTKQQQYQELYPYIYIYIYIYIHIYIHIYIYISYIP